MQETAERKRSRGRATRDTDMLALGRDWLGVNDDCIRIAWPLETKQ